MLSNIKVFVRCRARNERELAENAGVVLSVPSREEVCVRAGSNQRTYGFDRVFGAESDQESVFESVAEPMLEQMVAGYNCTVFAYGQTGTGKTHTMVGDLGDLAGTNVKLRTDAGIIPRAMFRLFELLKKVPDYSVKVSFIELYNENIRDLLGDGTRPLKIFDDAGKKGVLVHGIHEVYVRSPLEGLRYAQQGLEKRKVASTKCNDLSSRSHTVFSVTVHMRVPDPHKVGGEELVKVGKLNLVDLAGSENISRSGATNQRAKEAGMINQSLLTLGRVINALVASSPHIPYRESKLTRLLQDSLGGQTKTSIIATLSPAKTSFEETLSTLEYAHTAKSIKNKPQVNEVVNKKTLLREYMDEIERLTKDLEAARTQNGVYLDSESYQKLCSENESRQIRIEELEARVGGQEDRFERTKERLEQEQQEKKKLEQELADSVAETAKLRELLEKQAAKVQASRLEEAELMDSARSMMKSMGEKLGEQNCIQTEAEKLFIKNSKNWELQNQQVRELGSMVSESLTEGMAQTQKAFRELWSVIRSDLHGVSKELSGMNSSCVMELQKRNDDTRGQTEGQVNALEAEVCERFEQIEKKVAGVFSQCIDTIKSSRSLICDLERQLGSKENEIRLLGDELRAYVTDSIADKQQSSAQAAEELVSVLREAVVTRYVQEIDDLVKIGQHAVTKLDNLEKKNKMQPEALKALQLHSEQEERNLLQESEAIAGSLKNRHIAEWKQNIARFRGQLLAQDDERSLQIRAVSLNITENLKKLETCVEQLETKYSRTVDHTSHEFLKVQQYCDVALHKLGRSFDVAMKCCEDLHDVSRLQNTQIADTQNSCDQLQHQIVILHRQVETTLDSLEKMCFGSTANTRETEQAAIVPAKRAWNDDKENQVAIKKERTEPRALASKTPSLNHGRV